MAGTMPTNKLPSASRTDSRMISPCNEWGCDCHQCKAVRAGMQRHVGQAALPVLCPTVRAFRKGQARLPVLRRLAALAVVEAGELLGVGLRFLDDLLVDA